jgi:proteic killer suppression protein
MAIQSFRCNETKALYEGESAHRFNHIKSVAERKMQMLEDAVELRDLRSPPGNRLEQLSGNRSGQHGIRINDQCCVCFLWAFNGPEDVEMVGYH